MDWTAVGVLMLCKRSDTVSHLISLTSFRGVNSHKNTAATTTHTLTDGMPGVPVAVKVVRLMDTECGNYSSRSLDALKQEIQVGLFQRSACD